MQVLLIFVGTIKQGFGKIIAQFNRGYESATASLPANPELAEALVRWQLLYQALTQWVEPTRSDFEIEENDIVQVSVVELEDICGKICQNLNEWLDSSDFLNIDRRLHSYLHQDKQLAITIQSEDEQLRRLPWHLWDFYQEYQQVSISLSPLDSEYLPTTHPPQDSVRILGILGDSTGISLEGDRTELTKLPRATVRWMEMPSRAELGEHLWEEQWDILFFGGHSSSNANQGRLAINLNESITIEQLKSSLKKAIEKGLKLAILNSCDGLALAYALTDLSLPRIIVMQEDVPNLVAQKFLEHLVKALAKGEPLELAYREAKARLQHLEGQFPAASWLPVLFQVPNAPPFTWLSSESRDKEYVPYRGLFPFQEQDAPFFFGRERYVNELLKKVLRHNFVAVLGASGSGKSSLIFAGLLPHLRDHGNWMILTMRPGANPFYSLATTLVESTESHWQGIDKSERIQELEQKIRSDAQAIAIHLENIVRPLLIVDQFEEIYTLCQDKHERRQFLEALLRILDSIPLLHLVITLRADFLESLLEHPGLGDKLGNSDVKLSPMTRVELEEVITKPAERLGVVLQDGLKETIIKDLQSEPGNLPLLEFTLAQLWERRTLKKLTHEAYNQIGGVANALAQYAQKIYESLNFTEQKIAQQIFLALVKLRENDQDTRQQVKLQDLVKGEQTAENFDNILNKLAQAKLIVIDQQDDKVIDLVHESLILHWPLFRQWVTANKDVLREKQKIEADAEYWQSKNKSQDLLLQGLKLAEAENFYRNCHSRVSLSQLAESFVNESINLKKWRRLQKVGLGIFSAVCLIGAGIIMAKINHYNYFNGTIYSVQTVDFNILSHTLPTKVSHLLINQDTEELQRVLNSNYGLFGIVVTNCSHNRENCPEQKILCMTRSYRTWQAELKAEDLPKHPYNLLYNPPPLFTEKSNRGPYKPDWNHTGQSNSGKIIGRVYYIRGIPPTVLEFSTPNWLAKMFYKYPKRGKAISCNL